MVLSTNTQSLQLILNASAATTEPQFVISYKQWNKENRESIAVNRGTTTGGTAITLVAAPDAGAQREVQFIGVQNRDSGNLTVTIRLNDDGTTYDIYESTLSTNETLIYDKGAGFQSFTTAGALK